MMSPAPAGHPGRGGGWVLLASRLSPGASPVRQALRPPGLWPPTSHRSLGPGLVLGHSGTRGQDCQERVALGEALLPAQEDEENATFVSCSHLALAARGGGARGGRCGSAPPTGNFRKMLVGAGGWQTWQRRVGPAPKPTTKKGGG